jgi:hypothetical protein
MGVSRLAIRVACNVRGMGGMTIVLIGAGILVLLDIPYFSKSLFVSTNLAPTEPCSLIGES